MRRLLTDPIFIVLILLNAAAIYASTGVPVFRLLVPPLLGALIGYITNVLAVWMIFNPKRPVLGYQGIIPRSKDELALRLAEVIERELVNPDSILNLLSERRREIERGIAKAIVRTMASEDRPFKLLLGENHLRLKRLIVEFYLSHTDAVSDVLREVIEDEGVVVWFEEHVLKNLYEGVAHISLSSTFPGIEEVVWNGVLKVVRRLSDPEVSDRVAALIDEALNRSQRGKPEGFVLSVLNSLTGGYSRRKIRELLETLPEVVEADGKIQQELRTALRFILNKPIGEIITYQVFAGGFTAVASFLLEELSKEKTLTKLLRSERVVEILEKTVDALLSLSPSQIVSKVGEERFGKAVEEILEGSFPFVLPFVKEVVNKVDIKRIVQERIEQYSVEEMEDLVFGMMSREFRFIEYMGIPIGAMVGALQLLVNALHPM